ncbi:hypothetical protein [Peteryoungia ipomoeae]|uniref:Uncharacterized protein n=1 Tax=Peteryoungia ipomoeae TaxID=1210932 RepID=A0A4S8P6P2_9HYPH|nr:hypothetical protein [Peteryoungia ipomoeae]THV25081.1 hypothetical protein FAA97_02435 [Peteryoungia ipomoeae]
MNDSVDYSLKCLPLLGMISKDPHPVREIELDALDVDRSSIVIDHLQFTPRKRSVPIVSLKEANERRKIT